MLLNAETAISTSKILLVPYCTWHVPRYHEWMQDKEIQEATASEPLTLEEEYAMQRSWRQDADKLTFIACRPNSAVAASENPSNPPYLKDEDDSPANMVGDINLFLRVDDDEEDDPDSDSPAIIGEIELMIAEKVNQRQGYGKAALVTFLKYVIEKQDLILEEFVSDGCGGVDGGLVQKIRGAASGGLAFGCLSVKIGEANRQSLALFEGLGFMKVREEVSFFGEFELRRKDLGRLWIDLQMEKVGVDGYVEVEYRRRE